MSDYTPVDCALQDKLEAIAIHHQMAKIAYKTQEGSTQAEDEIVDIYADSGADYCKLKGGTVIRLDKLEAITVDDEKVW